MRKKNKANKEIFTPKSNGYEPVVYRTKNTPKEIFTRVFVFEK